MPFHRCCKVKMAESNLLAEENWLDSLPVAEFCKRNRPLKGPVEVTL
jgi:hypothetical protein